MSFIETARYTEAQKALELAIGSIEKEFGRGSIMRLAEGQKIGGDVADIGHSVAAALVGTLAVVNV